MIPYKMVSSGWQSLNPFTQCFIYQSVTAFKKQLLSDLLTVLK